jgi:predicted P-loop ATPase
MHTAVDLVAERNQFDSAVDWCRSLVWDGVCRIDKAMSTYFGCEDTPYTRAVGTYLFTALAGRALVPGCQADMAIVLIGLQGARKTSAIAAISPSPEAFGEVNLSKTDEQLAYILRGKLVIEIAEMRGITGRDSESTKAWVTRRVEEWREPYKRMTTKYPRRAILLGSANEIELFDDPTGERRWLPTIAGRTDVAALERDRAQLWAEGVARFTVDGIAWQEAERLATAEHGKFIVSDEWAGIIAHWLEAMPLPVAGQIPSPFKNGEIPISLHEMAWQALGLKKSDITMREEKRIGKILRYAGYEKIVVRDGQILGKKWAKKNNSDGGKKSPTLH